MATTIISRHRIFNRSAQDWDLRLLACHKLVFGAMVSLIASVNRCAVVSVNVPGDMAHLQLLQLDQVVLRRCQNGLLLFCGLAIPVGIGEGEAGIAAQFVPIAP